MSTAAEDVLRAMVLEVGHELTQDVRRCENHLRDYFGNRWGREQSVLLAGVRSGAAAALAGRSTASSVARLVDTLDLRLQHLQCIEPCAARWSIQCWAFALGAVQSRPGSLQVGLATIPAPAILANASGPLAGRTSSLSTPPGPNTRAGLTVARHAMAGRWGTSKVVLLSMAAFAVAIALLSVGRASSEKAKPVAPEFAASEVKVSRPQGKPGKAQPATPASQPSREAKTGIACELKPGLASKTAARIPGCKRLNDGMVGVTLQRNDTSSIPVIKHTLAGGAAARAGVVAGSRILRIDGLEVQSMSAEEAAERIRGKVGTVVRLDIEAPGGKRRTFKLVRE